MYSDYLEIIAPAKVNFFLEIVDIAENGYHLLESIMQTISLSDSVFLKKSTGKDVDIKCKGLNLDSSDNTAYKAALEFFFFAGLEPQGLDIVIEKNIPSQAGLGGGSSDAAATLVGMNNLYNTNFTQFQLCEIGAKVGADIPFCIVGGGAVVRGIGEKITPINPLTNCHLLVVKPPAGVNTNEAFNIYDSQRHLFRVKSSERIVSAWKNEYLEDVGRFMYNIFEKVVNLDDVVYLKQAMKTNGAFGAVMSGSGSAVVGLFDTLEKTESCARFLREEYDEIFIAEPITKGAYIAE